MDDADIAIRNDLFFNQLALKAHKNRVECETEWASGIYCENCGEPIPEARRRAVPGCVMCVECQAEEERW